MVKITIVHTADCQNCKEAERAVAELSQRYGDIATEMVTADSDQGQELIIRHGILASPGILIDGEFFSMGVVSKEKLEAAVSGKLKAQEQ